MDLDGRIVEANSALARMCSVEAGSLRDAPLWDMPGAAVAAAGRVAMRAAVAAAANGAAVRHDIELATSSGLMTLDLSLRPLLDDAGSIELVLAELRDITERKAAEVALRASEERFNGIVSIAVDAILSIDASQNITMFNRGAERIFGYSAHEVIGRPLGMLMPDATAPTHHDRVEQFAASPTTARRMGERGNIFGRRKNGEVFPAEASISKVQVGETISFTAMLRDVSDRWAQEEERKRLLSEAERMRARAEEQRERLAIVTRAGDLLNETLGYDQTLRVLAHLLVPEISAFCIIHLPGHEGMPRRTEVLHADPAMAKAVDCIRGLPAESRMLCWSETTLESVRPKRVEAVDDAFLNHLADDANQLALLRALRPVSCLCVPLIARDRSIGTLTVVREASQPPFSESDADLVQNIAWRATFAIDNANLFRKSIDASAQRDHVLGVVSHDLGNALSAIAMNTTAMRGPAGGRAADRARLTATVLESVDFMRRLIGDLLDISSAETGSLSIDATAVDPVIMLAHAVHMFEQQAEERSIRVDLHTPDELPDVMADEGRVLQVLSNLLVNALKHTPPGGTVTLDGDATADGVVFTVKDTGPGIPAEIVPRIFDRFFHMQRGREQRGTGLGLAIARGIVEAHGGRIWVETSPGQGATFRFVLPTVSASEAALHSTAD
jgi:PAS domain S-box-containing protein